MRYRVLTAEEASRIPGMVSPAPYTLLAIGAVDDSGDVVGCIGTFPALHADPLWVREDYRGRGVILPRLWARTVAELRARGVGSVEVLMTVDVPGQPIEDMVARMCESVGGIEVKLRHFVVPLHPLEE